MRFLLTTLIVIFGPLLLEAQNENSATMQDWKYPYTVHKTTISDSIEMAYVDEGTGDHTLLFIHGLGSNLKAWQKNIDSLKSKYRCIAIDLPGYGKSGKGDYTFEMTFFAETLNSFITELKLENVVLIGHSMGGQVALHLALNQPKLVKQLALIAPAGFETFTDAERAWFENLYTPQVVKAAPEAQIVKNFELNFHDMPEDARFMIEDRLQMRLTSEYDYYCEMIPQCVLGMLNQPVFDRLSTLEVPTLIIYGEHDMLIPNRLLHPTLSTAQVAEAGQNQINGSELQLISEAGHFVQWEQAKVVNTLLLQFLP